jgi:hypothetical protein
VPTSRIHALQGNRPGKKKPANWRASSFQAEP